MHQALMYQENLVPLSCIYLKLGYQGEYKYKLYTIVFFSHVLHDLVRVWCKVSRVPAV